MLGRPEPCPAAGAPLGREGRLVPLGLGAGLLVPLIAGLARGGAGAPAGDPAPVRFGREVRPILSEHCFACHGPDAGTREADLRLDRREDALRDRGGYAAIVPGRSEESELVRRVSAAEERMPPPEHAEALPPEAVETLRRWIDEGAEWNEHWSYVPPVQPAIPAVRAADWPRNPIDSFVLARLEGLEQGGLAPAPEAAREALIRRLAFDLTGLPPAPGEVARFLSDESPGAWEALVERLLASPRYGEAFAREWLDAARYGDTHGFHLDNEREIWPYRDWVVRAFNENLPFDRFTVEQLAGDLLPDATTDQLVATGFNRCNPTTAEGGLIDEEYLVKYAVDRASTTATVWMGMTLACATCHDHKFDPLSQREFYEFYAFFNNVADEASDGNASAPPPFVRVPSAAQAAELARLAAELDAVTAERDGPLPEVDGRQAAWEAELEQELAGRWSAPELLALSSASGTSLERLDDGSLLASGENPEREVFEILVQTELTRITALRLEALTHASLPPGEQGRGGPGRGDNANFVLSKIELEAAPRAGGGTLAPVKLVAATADYAQEGCPAGAVLDGDRETGWATLGNLADRVLVLSPDAPFGFDGGTLLRVRLRFESRFPRHALGRLRLSLGTDPRLLPAQLGEWSALGPFPAESGAAAHATDFGPEGAGAVEADWSSHPEWKDGELVPLQGETCATYARRTLVSPDERQATLSLGSDDGLKAWLNGELVLDADVQRAFAPDQSRVRVRLRPGENELLLKLVNHAGDYGFSFRLVEEDLGGLPLAVAEALRRPPAERDAAGLALVRDAYRRAHSPEWQAIDQRLAALRAEHDELEARVPTSLVVQERAERRAAHVLIRGQYDQLGEPVEPDVPSCLPPLPPAPAGQRPDRLALARWLVDPGHPLTARVAVNRLWEHFFGAGLVATAEDLGSQGEWPSHPELLDWLALELVESGWDVKRVVRLIVGSATYRQDSAHVAERVRLDPAGRLFSRGPRFRLDGEEIRDAALAIAGLLVEDVGGPPVKPYQPEGIWKAVAYTTSNTAEYERGSGAALYRRSLYTFWKRTAPPPTLQLFDAPTRETCTLRRSRTNTPLQALALLNDVQFVEAARVFAERILREGGASDEERLGFAFVAATARRPAPEEADVLRRILAGARGEYAQDEAAALVLLQTGEHARDEALDPREVAAWTHVATTLLNLDETVTKG